MFSLIEAARYTAACCPVGPGQRHRVVRGAATRAVALVPTSCSAAIQLGPDHQEVDRVRPRSDVGETERINRLSSAPVFSLASSAPGSRPLLFLMLFNCCFQFSCFVINIDRLKTVL